MKLIIQIPCLNERDHLPPTFADLPRSIEGIDSIEVLVIDDGSTDGTSQVARDLGAHHIVRFPQNRGLSAAYNAGLDACVRLGADIIVNTDADNQYRGDDIAGLVEPIVAGRADLVVGNRDTDTIAHFSSLKKRLQKLGSGVVRGFSGTNVIDATSGFRAISRKVAATLFIHNRFTYTLESLIQAGQAGIVTENVTIRTNPKARESRLFRSIPNYLRRNGLVILRSYGMYRPMRTFGMLAVIPMLLGLALGGRFLYLFIADPSYSGHMQSLLVGVGSILLSFLVALMALLGDLIAANRRLAEETLRRVRHIEAGLLGRGQGSAQGSAQDSAPRPSVDGVESTGADPWRPPVAA